MSYSFQRFTEVGKRFEDRITVTRGRSIGLPTRFYVDNKISEYKFGVLFYDKENNAIGIHFTNNDNEVGKISITKSKQDYGAHIPANSFFKANRINSKKYAGRYEYKKLSPEESGVPETEALFVIELKEKEEGMTNEK